MSRSPTIVEQRRLGRFALVCALAGAACGQAKSPTSKDGKGTAITSTALDGTALDPLSVAGDELRVLVFVSTHCPISNRYAPTLAELHASYDSRGVDFFLVYPDPADEPDAIRTHVAEFSLPGTPVRDPEHSLVAAAGARVTPEVAVFQSSDPERPRYHGRIDDRVQDFGKIRAQANERTLAQALDALIGGDSPPARETTAVGCYIKDLR